jgi:hypothetical protein
VPFWPLSQVHPSSEDSEGGGGQEVNKQQFPDEKNWQKFVKTFFKKYYCIAGSDKKHT